MRYLYRRRPERRSTETSRALATARRAARSRLDQAGLALGVHPPTIRRWELGEAKPTRKVLARTVALYAVEAPEAVGPVSGADRRTLGQGCSAFR